jgi:hypothetical protein
MSIFLTLVVTQCAFNQSKRYWLLFNVILVAISLCVTMCNNNFDTNYAMYVYGPTKIYFVVQCIFCFASFDFLVFFLGFLI